MQHRVPNDPAAQSPWQPTWEYDVYRPRRLLTPAIGLDYRELDYRGREQTSEGQVTLPPRMQTSEGLVETGGFDSEIQGFGNPCCNIVTQQLAGLWGIFPGRVT